MDSIDYRGYEIFNTPDGYYTVEDIEFCSVDEAMDWIDEQEDYVPEIPQPHIAAPERIHTYHFFYVDRATDRSFNVLIEAKNYKEAEKKLRREYDVYRIADCYQIDED